MHNVAGSKQAGSSQQAAVSKQRSFEFLVFERISTIIFLVEYILRVWVAVENDNVEILAS